MDKLKQYSDDHGHQWFKEYDDNLNDDKAKYILANDTKNNDDDFIELFMAKKQYINRKYDIAYKMFSRLADKNVFRAAYSAALSLFNNKNISIIDKQSDIIKYSLMAIDNKDIDGYLALVDLHKLIDSQSGIHNYVKSIMYPSDDIQLHKLGSKCYNNKLFSYALEYFFKCDNKDYLQIGNCYEKLNKTDLKIACYKKYIDNRNDTMNESQLIICLEICQYYKLRHEAEKYLNIVEHNFMTNTVMAKLGIIYIENNDYANAIKYFTMYLNSNGNSYKYMKDICNYCRVKAQFRTELVKSDNFDKLFTQDNNNIHFE